MVYTYDFPNITGGLDGALADASTGIPSLIPMILIFVYFIVLLAGSSAQYRRVGTSDIPMWSTMAGLSTTMVALMMSLSAGIINTVVFTIVISVTILSAFWLFMTRGRFEN